MVVLEVEKMVVHRRYRWVQTRLRETKIYLAETTAHWIRMDYYWDCM